MDYMEPIGLQIKRKYLKLLQLIFGYNDWQLGLLQDRPYAIHIVKRISNMERKVVVEVGCGLGEIISSIKADVTIGYDINKRNIWEARFVHPKVKFVIGSFDRISGMDIDVLIMVNFIHLISPENLATYIKNVIENNNVRMFVIDTFLKNEGTGYKYSHSGEYLFGDKYALISRSKGFVAAEGARRFIEYWEKK